MIFSTVIIILALLITYLHYLQGLFSAAISFGCAVMAALIAFGYYENIVNLIGGSKYGDLAGGVVLILLFTSSYTAFRTIFDKVLPGNLSVPLYVERVGAAVLGLVAAVIATGTLAVAAQLMPFGPSIGGYARYEVQNRDINNARVGTGNQRGIDSAVQDEMTAEAFKPEESVSMLLPVDSIMLNLVALSSDGGYSGNQSFTQVHPDLPTEAFGARLGADHSGKRVIFNTSKRQAATVAGIFYIEKPTPASPLQALDSEVLDIRPSKKAMTGPGSNARPIVIRAVFDATTADPDGYVRITPAAIRLHLNGVDYWPFGTMQTANKVALNRIDDLILIGGSRTADFAFSIPEDLYNAAAKGELPKDAFVEMKLFGRITLATLSVTKYSGPTDATAIARKLNSPLVTPPTTVVP